MTQETTAMRNGAVFMKLKYTVPGGYNILSMNTLP